MNNADLVWRLVELLLHKDEKVALDQYQTPKDTKRQDDKEPKKA